MQGIKVTSISKSAISDTMIAFPRDLAEQYCIGKSFLHLDRLITLHQRKCKTSVASVQAKTWEQRKLGEICEVLTGGEAPRDYIKERKPVGEYKYPIFSNGLGENALWGFARTYRINVPAITFSSIGTLGFPELRSAEFTPIIRLKVIIPKSKNIDISFLKYSLCLANFSNNAGGIPNINAESVKTISIVVAKKIQEQRKIRLLLETFDRLVTLHQRKLKWLDNIRKRRYFYGSLR